MPTHYRKWIRWKSPLADIGHGYPPIKLPDSAQQGIALQELGLQLTPNNLRSNVLFPDFSFSLDLLKILVFSKIGKNFQSPFLTPNQQCIWLDEITSGRKPPIRSQKSEEQMIMWPVWVNSSWWRHQSIAVAITTWNVQNELSRLNITGAIQWTWLVYEVTNQRLVSLANV